MEEKRMTIFIDGELPYKTDSNNLENTINNETVEYFEQGTGGVKFETQKGTLIILPYTSIKRIEIETLKG